VIEITVFVTSYIASAMFSPAFSIVLALFVSASAFEIRGRLAPRVASIFMNKYGMEPKSPLDAISKPLGKGIQTASLIAGAFLAVNQRPLPAKAAGKLETANEKLSSYGLPPILFVPNGFVPLVSEFGRGNIRESQNGVGDNPVLVQFSHPQVRTYIILCI
jgi:hypothetical protein